MPLIVPIADKHAYARSASASCSHLQMLFVFATHAPVSQTDLHARSGKTVAHKLQGI
jgi:hypothetical protein